MAFYNEITQYNTLTTTHCDNFNEVNQKLLENTLQNHQDIGNLNLLSTTQKDSLVSAVNEVKQSIPSSTNINQTIDQKISTHNQLTTSHQDIRSQVKTLENQIQGINISANIETHNTNQTAHQDIRSEINGLSTDRGYLITKHLEDNTDFNDIPKLNGIYMVSTRTNAPMILDYNQWYFVKVTVHNESYLTQEAWTFVGEKSQRWVRVLDNNVWKPWVKMVDVNEFNSLSDQTLYVQNLPFSILKDMTYKKRYISLTVLTTEQETELGLPNNDGHHWWYFTYEPDVWTGSSVGTQKVKNYHSGNVYERGSDGVFHKLATTTKTDILFTPKPSFTILNQKNSKINNILHINVEVGKTDGSMFTGGQFVNVVTLPFNVWNTTISMIGSYGGFFQIAGCGIAYETHLSVIPSKECQSIRISGVIVL